MRRVVASPAFGGPLARMPGIDSANALKLPVELQRNRDRQPRYMAEKGDSTHPEGSWVPEVVGFGLIGL